MAGSLVSLNIRTSLREELNFIWGQVDRRKKLDYEGMPFQCHKCHQYGHMAKQCQLTFKNTLEISKKRTIELEEEGTFLRKQIDEETIKTKFENSSKILDDILMSQKPSNDKIGLGYDNERKTKCSSFTN